MRQDNDTILRENLMTSARSVGICKDGYSQMRGYDRDGLVSYYVENPDWCIERGFPSLETIRREFSDIEDKGVFVGKTFDGEVFDKLQAYIFHDCKGTIKVAMDYDNAVIPMLYFANGCKIRVKCEQDNKPVIIVPLYVSEDCNVSHGNSDGCIFRCHTIKHV